MVSALARYLKQSIDEVEEWDTEKFFRYYDSIDVLLKAETPEK